MIKDSYDHDDQEQADMDAYKEERSGLLSWLFPWKQSRSKNEGKYLLIGGNTYTKEVTCCRKKLNKANEFTEVYGGPKWKNLVRKIGAYCRGCRKQKARLCKKKTLKKTFQYDMNSYNLNFDNGSDGDDWFADFSARFAAPSSLICQQGPVHASALYNLKVILDN